MLSTADTPATSHDPSSRTKQASPYHTILFVGYDACDPLADDLLLVTLKKWAKQIPCAVGLPYRDSIDQAISTAQKGMMPAEKSIGSLLEVQGTTVDWKKWLKEHQQAGVARPHWRRDELTQLGEQLFNDWKNRLEQKGIMEVFRSTFEISKENARKRIASCIDSILLRRSLKARLALLQYLRDQQGIPYRGMLSRLTELREGAIDCEQPSASACLIEMANHITQLITSLPEGGIVFVLTNASQTNRLAAYFKTQVEQPPAVSTVVKVIHVDSSYTDTVLASRDERESNQAALQDREAISNLAKTIPCLRVACSDQLNDAGECMLVSKGWQIAMQEIIADDQSVAPSAAAASPAVVASVPAATSIPPGMLCTVSLWRQADHAQKDTQRTHPSLPSDNRDDASPPKRVHLG